MGDCRVKKRWNLSQKQNDINKDSFFFFFIFKMCKIARLEIQRNPINQNYQRIKTKKKKSKENNTFF